MKNTAEQFITAVKKLSSPAEQKKLLRYFKTNEGDVFIGVPMGKLFALAKEHIDMPVSELEKLLENPIHEVRAGALSIMDKDTRRNKIPESRRKELYDLYMRRHDRINNWDLVDVSAIYVVGRYLQDKPRKVLYKMARSKNMWERRTAIVATAYFLKNGERDDTFAIAEILVKDKEDLIHKAAGGWIRQAGKGDKAALLQFLDKYAATMPRTMLRYAIEHLDVKQKKHYMELKKVT
ncbi:DNA alkylation repair protein [Chitinophaga sp. SYP-B3965]|uniref:DNA alkylation repair protein n=1 Tax=Chitinophaga sp. SYP-B3965 TaxID=2663120 RepID=UPI001299635B|nr:DNA alkylation repair protein [Chitinophaga sp. SYP-B3965]MRG45552.1 DNA alkylation repair protein [Chitinophaga sp. SYP-B3965]